MKVALVYMPEPGETSSHPDWWNHGRRLRLTWKADYRHPLVVSDVVVQSVDGRADGTVVLHLETEEN